MRNFLSFHQDTEPGATLESAGTHRWTVSYADFVTLLFVLFLVLYARLPKQEPVSAPATPSAAPPMLEPIIPGIRPHRAGLSALSKHAPAVPDAERVKQKELLDELANTFTDLAQAGEITLEIRSDGVLLDIKDTALFASGTAQPAPQAGAIVSKIAAVLINTNKKIVVEGHTDSVPIQTAQFPSNWELSSARAASVVRELQEHGIAANRLSASGLADTKPRSSNDTAQGRSENRRVSLLVLNGQT